MKESLVVHLILNGPIQLRTLNGKQQLTLMKVLVILKKSFTIISNLIMMYLLEEQEILEMVTHLIFTGLTNRFIHKSQNS